MGCDIHCYIEHKTDGGWRPHGGGLNPGRNYDLFAKLAGVRNYAGVVPVSSPRGLPEDVAYRAKSDNLISVTEEGVGDGECSRASAERWVTTGISRYVDPEKQWVSNPDWHSHSWLATQEFEQAVEGCGDIEYEVLLETMRAFEARGHASRIVFWFDN